MTRLWMAIPPRELALLESIGKMRNDAFPAPAHVIGEHCAPVMTKGSLYVLLGRLVDRGALRVLGEPQARRYGLTSFGQRTLRAVHAGDRMFE